MLRKKTKLNLVEVDFTKKALPEFDFRFILKEKGDPFARFGLQDGVELHFKYVDDFLDGDFIALPLKGRDSFYYGFGFSLNNSILIGLWNYSPVPRKDIKGIAKLVTPIELSREGNLK